MESDRIFSVQLNYSKWLPCTGTDETGALSYAFSRVGLPGITIKQEQLTAIRYLYAQKDVFLWLPTSFGKSVCYEVLPILFDFAGSKSGSVLSPLVSLMVH